LSFLSSFQFRGLVNLQYLQLTNNRLFSLPQDIVVNIQTTQEYFYIYLGGNPGGCDNFTQGYLIPAEKTTWSVFC